MSKQGLSRELDGDVAGGLVVGVHKSWFTDLSDVLSVETDCISTLAELFQESDGRAAKCSG